MKNENYCGTYKKCRDIAAGFELGHSLPHVSMLDTVVSSTIHPNVDDPTPWTAQPLASLPPAAYTVLSLSYFLGRLSGEALGLGQFGLSAGIDPTYRGPASLEAVSKSSESVAQGALQGLTCD